MSVAAGSSSRRAGDIFSRLLVSLSPGLPVLLAALYLTLALGNAVTRRPMDDEALYASPGLDLVTTGHMGITNWEPLLVHPSIARRVYIQPPLHFLAVAAWFKLFGFSNLSLRCLSVFWGMVVLCAWYALLHAITRSPLLSLITVGFLSTDYFFLLGVSDGRMDMMCNALGTSGLAAYMNLRQSRLPLAMILGNTLVAAAGLTHPNGLIYLAGMIFLVLYFDRKRLRVPYVAMAAAPYLLGAVGWGLYILQDVPGFVAQFSHNLSGSAKANDMPGPAWQSPGRALAAEIMRRYIGPFGLSPAADLASRLKAPVLLAYLGGWVGLVTSPLRRKKEYFALGLLPIIFFVVMTFFSSSKNYLYLHLNTLNLAACLCVYLLTNVPGKRRAATAVILGGLALLQIGGTVYKIRQNPYQASYRPLIHAIQEISPPHSLIMGSPSLWFGLYPERTLLHDPTFGYWSHREPDIIVMEPIYKQYVGIENERTPAVYQRYLYLLGQSRVVFEDGFYRVYQRIKP